MAKFISDDEMTKLEMRENNGRSPKFISDNEMENLERRSGSNATQISKTESAARGALQGATFGFSDEIAGVSESQPALDRSFQFSGNPALMEGDFVDPEKTYRQARDESRAANQAARQANPGSYFTGELAGGVASGMVLPGGNAGTLGQAMRFGALYGGTQGLGASEANSFGGLAIDSGLGTLIGAGGGAVGHGVVKGGEKIAEKAAPVIDKAKRYVGEKLKEIAETQAFKSNGAMKRDFDVAEARGNLRDIGRWLLDTGGVRFGDSVGKVAKRADSRLAAAGSKLDDIYSSAQEKFGEALNKVGFDPKRDKAELMQVAREMLGDAEGANKALNRLSEHLDEIAERHGDKPMEKAIAAYKRDVEAYLPKFRKYVRDRVEYRNAVGKAAGDANQPVLPGLIDDGQRAGTRTIKLELNGSDPKVARVSDTPELTQQGFLPDLPDGRSEVERVMGGVNNPFGKNLGSHLEDNLVPSAQRDFLNQNTADQISLFGKQGTMAGRAAEDVSRSPRTIARAERAANDAIKSIDKEIRLLQAQRQTEYTKQAIKRLAEEREAIYMHLDSANAPKAKSENLLTPRQYVDAEVPTVVNQGAQTRIPIEPISPKRPMRPQDIRNPMSPRRANDVKGAMDDVIDYSRNPLAKEPNSEKAFSAARSFVSKKIDESLDALGGDAIVQELKAANKEYGFAAEVKRIAQSRVNRENANKWFGLTDTITAGAAGTYGLTTGDWETAASVMIGKKVLDKYGASTVATAADRISKRLLQSPELQRVATSQPQVFQAAVINLTRRALDRTAKLPAAADRNSPSELDRDSGVPANYREYPSESRNEAPLKGMPKWMNDGIGKVQSSVRPELASRIEENRDALIRSSSGKRLLLAASGLNPGSKAMNGVVAQLEKELVRLRG